MQAKRHVCQWGSVGYFETGNPEGEPIVLLHGILSDSSGLARVAEILSSRHRLVLIDLPGHGSSPRPERFSYDDAARCVLDIVRADGLSPCVLCGCSLGGSVAQAAVSLDEEGLVRGLFVADAMPLDALAYSRTQAFAVDRSTSALRVSAQRSIRPVHRKIAKDLASTKKGRELADMPLSGESLDGLLWMNKAGNETLLRYVRHAGRSLLSDLPLGLAVGTRDAAVGVRARMGEWAAERESVLHRLEGSGHLSYLDDSEGFSSALLEFLKSLA